MFKDRAPQTAALVTVLALGLSACGSSDRTQETRAKDSVSTMEEAITGIAIDDLDITLDRGRLTPTALAQRQAGCLALVAQYNHAAIQHGGGTIHLPARIPDGIPGLDCK